MDRGERTSGWTKQKSNESLSANSGSEIDVLPSPTTRTLPPLLPIEFSLVESAQLSAFASEQALACAPWET